MTPWRIIASQPVDCPFNSGGAVARTRLQVPEFDQLCDDCQRRNAPLEADNNAAHATPVIPENRLCSRNVIRARSRLLP
jgi:hypothetical protein